MHLHGYLGGETNTHRQAGRSPFIVVPSGDLGILPPSFIHYFIDYTTGKKKKEKHGQHRRAEENQ